MSDKKRSEIMSIKPYHLPLVVNNPENVSTSQAIMNIVLFLVIIGLSTYLFNKQNAEYKNKKS